MKNKGFTLIELVVVIALMIVLIAVMGLGFATVNNMKVEEVAQQYHTGLENAQATCMSKNGGKITLSIQGDYIVMKIYDAKDNIRTDKQLGLSRYVTVTYYEKNSSGMETEPAVELSDKPIELSYDTVSGAFKFQEGTNGISRIVFSNGKKTKTITLFSNTGKNVLE